MRLVSCLFTRLDWPVLSESWEDTCRLLTFYHHQSPGLSIEHSGGPHHNLLVSGWNISSLIFE